MTRVVRTIRKDPRRTNERTKEEASSAGEPNEQSSPGGDTFSAPAVVDDAVLRAIEECAALAPLHNPANLEGIGVAREVFGPSVPQVAVFDTAFHATMGAEAYSYAVPRAVASKLGVRKYGFHGTSYAHVARAVRERFPGRARNMIVCHLGNGASMCCIRDGVSADTSMGLTPLEGLVMGTRCGDLDPAVPTFLMRHHGYSVEDVDRLLNKESGLKGVSGLASPDWRAVREAADAGNADAALARALFVERIRKYVGAYLVKLRGNVSCLVFTAGIGENDAWLRAAVCEGLAPFGIALDPKANEAAAPALARGASSSMGALVDVTSPFSKTKVLVAHTDEECEIACQSFEVIDGDHAVVTSSSSSSLPTPTPPLPSEEEQAIPPSHVPSTGRATPSPVAGNNKIFSLPLKDNNNTREISEANAVSVSSGRSRAAGKNAPIVAERGVYVDGPGRTMQFELGLLFALVPFVPRLGFFRPFAKDEKDRKLRLARSLFHDMTADPFEAQIGLLKSEAEPLLRAGQEAEVLDRIQERFMAYAEGKDFVLVSRAHSGVEGEGQFQASWCAKVAERLSIPVAYVARHLDTDQGQRELRGALAEYAQHSAPVAGVLAELPRGVTNLAGAEALSLRDDVTRGHGAPLAALLPHDAAFEEITVAELSATLPGCDIVFNRMDAAETPVDVEAGVVLATLDATRLIEALALKPPGQVVVVDATRTDILLALVLAHASGRFPALAAIVLTSEEEGDGDDKEASSTTPADGAKGIKMISATACAVLAAVESNSSMKMPPVLSMRATAFDAAQAIRTSTYAFLPSSTQKIESARSMLAAHIEASFLDTLLGDLADDAHLLPGGGSKATTKRSPGGGGVIHTVMPSLFKHTMYARARSDPQRIIMPEGDDPRVVAAALELARRGLCHVTLLGDTTTLGHNNNNNNHNDEAPPTNNVSFVDPAALSGEELAPFVDALVSARQHKGLTPHEAKELLRGDFNYFGTMMVQLGLADGMVSGARHSTAATMRPALQVIKLEEGYTKASSCFFMLFPDGVKVYADCAININPTAAELAEIAVATARTARIYGLEPRVALLSYATGDSAAASATVEKVAEATTLARATLARDAADAQAQAAAEGLLEEESDASLFTTPLEGPIQYDAAVDPAVAKVKFHGSTPSSAAGHASVLIFPELDAGNSAYKAAQHASNAVAIGPIMQGLRKPVNDLSRGASVPDIVETVVATCIQAQAMKRQR